MGDGAGENFEVWRGMRKFAETDLKPKLRKKSKAETKAKSQITQ